MLDIPDQQFQGTTMPKLPSLDITNAGLDRKTLQSYAQRMTGEAKALEKATKTAYQDDRCSINLPVDKQILKQTKALAKKHQNADAIVVCGIGGSNLGTMAVQEAMLGKLHNQSGKRPAVFYADTVDTFALTDLLAILTRRLKKGKSVIINGVSKSGGTTETTANFEILVDLLKKHDKNYADHVVVTTDEGSPFWKLANAKGFHHLAIPKKVGGRYSVFSAVGQYPLRVMGINVDELLKGAADMQQACLEPDIMKNPAMQHAALLHHHASHGKAIADLFLFATDLESIGKWYRQLMGESIGKEWNASHTKQVFAGITPTVSIGSTDLHSMAQLYLGGPKDKFTSFVTVESANGLRVPPDAAYETLVLHIQGVKLPSIMDAIFQGVSIAYQKGVRPSCHILLHGKTAYQIGALLQMHMIEMIHLGKLMDVNSFDQPNVEAYKIETKTILSGIQKR